VPDPAVGLDFDQPADVHLNLLAEIAFHAAFLLNGLAEVIDFIFRSGRESSWCDRHSLGRELLRALLPNAINRSQPDPKALLHRKIYTCDTCHAILLKKNLIPGAVLCFGLTQITRTTPRRWITLHLSQIFFKLMPVLS